MRVHEPGVVNNSNSKESLQNYSFSETTVERDRTELLIEGQPIYAEYDIFVSAMNDIGPAVASPRLVIGHSAEDGNFTVYNNLHHYTSMRGCKSSKCWRRSQFACLQRNAL
jgi:hypothetical protein